MSVIERFECHVCHFPVGAIHGVYCSVSPGHVRPDMAVRVEYVPAEQLQKAVGENERLRDIVRELLRFVPYEKPEQGPLPDWIVDVVERAHNAVGKA